MPGYLALLAWTPEPLQCLLRSDHFGRPSVAHTFKLSGLPLFFREA